MAFNSLPIALWSLIRQSGSLPRQRLDPNFCLLLLLKGLYSSHLSPALAGRLFNDIRTPTSPKFDGYRIQMRVENGEVTLKTRKGLDWTAKYPAIAASAASLSDAIIDGEICALDEHGAPDFAALQAALSEGKTDALVYFAFDLLFDGNEDLRQLPLTERKERLQTLLDKVGEDPRLRFVEHFETGGDAVLKSACKLSLEGIVSKQADAPWSYRNLGQIQMPRRP